MNCPIISIIVPVYKVEKYLERCIESIISQTYTNLDIILVDDGSPDQCPKICDKYSDIDNRVSVIHKSNGGLSSARNVGIIKAKGRYISFVDSDDFIMNDMIEQLYTTLVSSNADISVCLFGSNTKQMAQGIETLFEVFSSEEAIQEILLERKFHTSAWAKLYKIELFSEIKFPEGLIYEDYGTIYKLFDKASVISFVNSIKYFYTDDSESITRSSFSKKDMDYFTVSKDIVSFIESNYPDLLHAVTFRDTSMAISFYKKMSISGYCDSKIQNMLVTRIRETCIPFLCSGYPLIKRIAGLCIAVMPNLMKLILRCCGNSIKKKIR